MTALDKTRDVGRDSGKGVIEPAKVCVQPAAPEYSPSIYARAGEGGRALLGVGRDPGVVVACSAVVTGGAPHRAVP